jgi:histidinol phosphatase-like PHP family hydrolase
MYDLHTHTTMTDGEMIPVELLRRMSVLGYRFVAITDHADSTNLSVLLAALDRLAADADEMGLSLLRGVELTHVPPARIPMMATAAKKIGADIVVVHGETTVEPVAPGTNHAACTCPDVDVLAHPGLITLADAKSAAINGIALEVTSRGGHNRTNGHVAMIAREAGCQIVIDSDAHSPSDLLDNRAKTMVARGAGLTEDEARRVLSLNIERWRSHKI